MGQESFDSDDIEHYPGHHENESDAETENESDAETLGQESSDSDDISVELFGTTIGSINGLQRSAALLGAHVYYEINGEQSQWSFKCVEPISVNRMQAQSNNMPSHKLRTFCAFKSDHVKVTLVHFFNNMLLLKVENNTKKFSDFEVELSNVNGRQKSRPERQPTFLTVDGPTELKVCNFTDEEAELPRIRIVVFPMTIDDVRQCHSSYEKLDNWNHEIYPENFLKFIGFVSESFEFEKGNRIWRPFVPLVSNISLTVITSLSRTQQWSGLPLSPASTRTRPCSCAFLRTI